MSREEKGGANCSLFEAWLLTDKLQPGTGLVMSVRFACPVGDAASCGR